MHGVHVGVVDEGYTLRTDESMIRAKSRRIFRLLRVTGKDAARDSRMGSAEGL